MIRLICAACSLLLLTVACRTEGQRGVTVAGSRVPALRTGDLVLRCGADATSDLFRRFSRHDPRFSHCGWVVVEHGYPFVYHCTGSERRPGTPLQRDSLDRFLSPAVAVRYGAVRYAATPAQTRSLETYIRRCYRLPVRYDLQFDLATDAEMYCTEFAAKALRASGIGYAVRPDTVNGVPYIAADALYLGPGARLICDVAY